MRKIVILAGLLWAPRCSGTGTPAKAWVGCACVQARRGVRSACPDLIECTKSGGACLVAVRLRGAEKDEQDHGIAKKKKM